MIPSHSGHHPMQDTMHPCRTPSHSGHHPTPHSGHHSMQDTMHPCRTPSHSGHHPTPIKDTIPRMNPSNTVSSLSAYSSINFAYRRILYIIVNVRWMHGSSIPSVVSPSFPCSFLHADLWKAPLYPARNPDSAYNSNCLSKHLPTKYNLPLH